MFIRIFRLFGFSSPAATWLIVPVTPAYANVSAAELAAIPGGHSRHISRGLDGSYSDNTSKIPGEGHLEGAIHHRSDDGGWSPTLLGKREPEERELDAHHLTFEPSELVTGI